MKKQMVLIGILALTLSSCLIGCNKSDSVDNISNPIENSSEERKKDIINFNNMSAQEIYETYSEVGMKELKRLYPVVENRNFAVKNIGKYAKDFKFRTIDGKEINSNKFKGKNTILYISKTDCDGCKKVDKIIYDTYKNENLITIFPKNDKNSIKKLYNDLGLKNIKNVVAGQEEANSSISVIKDYEITHLPTLIFIDNSGKISFVNVGSVDEILLNDFLNISFGEYKLYNYLNVSEKIDNSK